MKGKRGGKRRRKKQSGGGKVAERRQKRDDKREKRKENSSHPKNAIIVTTATASSRGEFLRGLARSSGWSLTSGPGHCVHPAESLWRMRRTRPVSSPPRRVFPALSSPPLLLFKEEGGGGRSSRFCGLGGVGEGLSLLLLLLMPSLEEVTMER